jgi:hypothetical protein
MSLVVAFVIGLIWELGIAVQTRLVVFGQNYLIIAFWTTLLSLLWGFMVGEVVKSKAFLVSYALGTGVGVVVGIIISKLFI